MASLKMSGVDKIYPSGTLALYDINLETTDGEFLVVLGSDDSGKSTLLRVVSGLEEHSSGEIFIDGKDMTGVDPKDRNVAMVFRSNTLYPSLNVFDNMAFGLRLRKAPSAVIEQRVKAAANILGLNEVLFRKPKGLTSAQKQRVAIGRAIVREPKLYLFDQPLSGLDEKLQAEILNIIINLQARMEGTFIYCTDDVAEALSIGTRIVVLRNGMVQQIDSPANLYDYPANAYVAFYIGAPTINFMNKGRIVREDGVYYAEEGELKLPLAENTVSRFADIDGYAESGRNVIIGIRPEDAVLGGEGLPAKIEKTENDGSDYYAECTVCGHSLVVSAEADDKVGDSKGLNIDCTRLYLFDADTRLTLLSRDGGYKSGGYADENYAPLPYGEQEEVKEKFKPQKPAKKKK